MVTCVSPPLTVASVCFDDEACAGGSVVSEEDSETRSTCSLASSPSSPQELLSRCPFTSSSSYTSSSPSPSPTPSSPSPSPPPLSRPCSLDLPSTVSLSDFGLISPVLGPRSECSGASSPECDLERGACRTSVGATRPDQFEREAPTSFVDLLSLYQK